MTRAKSAVKFPLTRLAAGGLAVAGFLGLWIAIATTATSEIHGVDSAGGPVEARVVERQVVYLVESADATSSVLMARLRSATGGGLPSSSISGTAPAVVSSPPQGSSAPPKPSTSSAKKSKGS